MERILPIVEQLDRAAVELRLDHPLHNRLALILIDNAIEIMVGIALRTHVMLGGDFNGVTAAHRRKARSRSFPERLSVLVSVKELSSAEAAFVEAAHQHRNAAYHEGVSSEPFMRQVAFSYFQFACQYLARFEVGYFSWSTAFRHTEISQRYYQAATAADPPLGQLDRSKLADLLMAQLPEPPAKTLQDSLADDLQEDREQIASSFRFLIDNTPKTMTADRVLAKAQFDYTRDSALEARGLDQTSFDTPRRAEAVKFAKSNLMKFVPRYRSLPHGNWSQSILRIRSNPDARNALVQSRQLRNSMAFLREAIGYSAVRLEMELDRD